MTQTISRLKILFLFSLTLICAGIITIIIAALASSQTGSAGFGGIVFVGPLPIVFAFGSDPIQVALVSMVLAILTIVAFWLMRYKTRKADA
ncbi:MAG: DUF131 domain-containing protein [Candidatus Bathyarchaeia archaeon]